MIKTGLRSISGCSFPAALMDIFSGSPEVIGEKKK